MSEIHSFAPVRPRQGGDTCPQGERAYGGWRSENDSKKFVPFLKSLGQHFQVGSDRFDSPVEARGLETFSGWGRYSTLLNVHRWQ